MTHDQMVSSLKAAAWEEAKGRLRAVVALHGSRCTGDPAEYEEMRRVVEDFIREFQDNGHHE